MSCLLTQETEVCFLGLEDPLEKGLATHSSILARKIPWREEPVRLWSMGPKELDRSEATEQHACNQVIVPSLGTCSIRLKLKSSVSLDREELCMTFPKKMHYHVLLHSTLQFNQFRLWNTFWVHGRSALCCCCLVTNSGSPVCVQLFSDPMKCSLPSSTVHEIFQTIIL